MITPEDKLIRDSSQAYSSKVKDLIFNRTELTTLGEIHKISMRCFNDFKIQVFNTNLQNPDHILNQGAVAYSDELRKIYDTITEIVFSELVEEINN